MNSKHLNRLEGRGYSLQEAACIAKIHLAKWFARQVQHFKEQMALLKLIMKSVLVAVIALWRVPMMPE